MIINKKLNTHYIFFIVNNISNKSGESSILDRYKNNGSIRNSLFSRHRKKYFGGSYYTRIIFLLFLIITLTWYAKQGYNNPFASRLHFQLVGSGGNTYLHCFRKVKKKKTDSFLLLLPNFNSHSQKSSPINFPETGTLITTETRKDIYSNFKTPPAHWVILDTSLSNDTLPELPQTWPKPAFTNTIAGIKDISVNLVYPFDDTQKAVSLEYNKIKSILINNNQLLLDTTKESFFKEKFDIAIINTPSELSILKIREILRPRYLIVLPSVNTDEERQSFSNIIKPETDDFFYEIFKDSKKRLFVKIKRY